MYNNIFITIYEYNIYIFNTIIYTYFLNRIDMVLLLFVYCIAIYTGAKNFHVWAVAHF